MSRSQTILSDREVIRLIQVRNQKGIALLYDKYSTYLYGFIVQIVKRKDLSEIVMQNTFLKVWNNIDSYNEDKGLFLTWLVRIARNSSIDMMRAKNYKKNLKLLSLDYVSVDREPITNTNQMEYLDLRGIVANLDEKCSVILHLIYFEGYTCKEVAEELEIPLGTVKSRIRKGFKDLRKIIIR
ncbi:MAG: RNA polymerase sigma factor [Bacteroidota bacterium]